MKTKFAVKVHNKYLSEAVQKLAFDNGYKWNDSDIFKINNLGKPYLQFWKTDKVITWDEISRNEDTVYSALTDWQKIEEAMKPKEPRVIWVMGKDNKLTTYFLDKSDADNYHGEGISLIKFQEVIE